MEVDSDEPLQVLLIVAVNEKNPSWFLVTVIGFVVVEDSETLLFVWYNVQLTWVLLVTLTL